MENNDEFEYNDEINNDGPMPDEEHNPRSIQAMMGWLYDKAVSGIAGIESAETLAERYLADAEGDVTKAAHSMIRWESVKAGSTGFLSGVGGVVMPVTLPLNITSVLFLQTRLVAAIACLGKRNLADERIRALAGLCLCGNAAKALLQEVALQAMDNWTRPFTRRIVEKTLVLMAARAGVRTGGQFIRLVPLVGCVVSGAVDVTTTRTIGRIACTTFLPPYAGQRKS